MQIIIILTIILLLILVLFFIFKKKTQTSSTTDKKDNIEIVKEAPKPITNINTKYKLQGFRKNITFHGDYLDIDKIDFFGKYRKSANQKYIIAHSEDNKNEYVLLENNKILLHNKIDRPIHSSVANNGNFIINNWGIASNLCALFTIFNKNGEKIIEKELKANIYNSAISNDGRFVVCQTYESKYKSDSKKLLFFDLERKELLWKQEPTPGIANNYDFDINNKVLTLIYKSDKFYRYSFNGEFLDRKKWENKNNNLIKKEEKKDNKNDISKTISSENTEKTASKKTNKLEKIDPNDLFEKLEKEHKKNLENLSAIELEEYLEKFNYLLTLKDITSVKYKHARSYRYLGEIHLQLNQPYKALNNFEKALEISKRIGVKRITKQLRKKLKNK